MSSSVRGVGAFKLGRLGPHGICCLRSSGRKVASCENLQQAEGYTIPYCTNYTRLYYTELNCNTLYNTILYYTRLGRFCKWTGMLGTRVERHRARTDKDEEADGRAGGWTDGAGLGVYRV